MEKEIRDPTFSKFEKVFVRNKVVNFSPSVINVFLVTPDVGLEEPLADLMPSLPSCLVEKW